MPVVEIHLVEGDHDAARIEPLLRRVSERYAAIADSPIERVRAFVTMHRPEHWMTGGVTAAVDGDTAPYFAAAVLEGTTPAQRHRLLAELTDIICDVMGATRSRVRGRIVQVPRDDWATGGVPASYGRRPEVVARSSRL
jgi:phenylpyruvate tautomerase PptA (4-oxalocrotonate tautomerase family)